MLCRWRVLLAILCLSIQLLLIENQLDFGNALVQRQKEENGFYPWVEGNGQMQYSLVSAAIGCYRNTKEGLPNPAWAGQRSLHRESDI